jgi:hypothetical protein
LLPLFSVTIFVGAALLFLLELMVARMALPRLGGSPAVWNTCMVFFQGALLAGYALAHWSVKWLGVRRQVVLQIGLVLSPVLVLPAAVHGVPGGAASPVLWLLAALVTGVGMPFVVVATGGPVLARWFGATGHRQAADPYFLYAAANAGSLIALLAYPVLVEPRLGLVEQGRLWAGAYWVFAGLVVVCGVLVWRRGQEHHAEARRAQRGEEEEAGVWRRVWWVALAFVPSSLTLGVTQHLSTDIAAVPLLWVVPLAIYLLTFVVAFSRWSVPVRIPARGLPAAVAGLAIIELLSVKALVRPGWFVLSSHVVVLALAALVCHTRLAMARPRASRLTEFLLLVALGGVLGGVFNALVAPVVFKSVLEYPIALVLAVMVAPRVPSWMDRLPRALVVIADVAVPVLIGGLALWLDERVLEQREAVRIAVAVGAPMLVFFAMGPRPMGCAIGLAAVLAMSHFTPRDGAQRVLRERTFFGVYTVTRSDVFTTLTHGTTIHGLQYVPEAFRQIPLGYYHPEGPIGQVFKAYGAATSAGGRPLLEHIGLVGMGTGALAMYVKPGQRVTFHEIDPAVVEIAKNPECFTYLSGCKGTWDLAPVGDGRRTINAVADGEYGLIVLDAFSSDSIPVHLLTREAIEIYRRKLRPRGLIAFHISNHYIDLEPVLASAAREMGMAALVRTDDIDEKEQADSGRYGCVWVVMARDRADLTALESDARWKPAREKPGVRAWTDDFSNIWSVFDWN